MRSSTRLAHLLMLAAATLAAQADEPPKLRAGLWEVSITQSDSGRPARSVKMCIGSDTVSLLTRSDGVAAPDQSCAKPQVRIEGSQVTADGSCKLQSSVISTHTVTTYTGNTALHSETQAHYEPPLFGKRDGRTVRSARWLGECETGMRAGDVVMANGMKMNLLDLAHAAK